MTNLIKNGGKFDNPVLFSLQKVDIGQAPATTIVSLKTEVQIDAENESYWL